MSLPDIGHVPCRPGEDRTAEESDLRITGSPYWLLPHIIRNRPDTVVEKVELLLMLTTSCMFPATCTVCNADCRQHAKCRHLPRADCRQDARCHRRHQQRNRFEDQGRRNKDYCQEPMEPHLLPQWVRVSYSKSGDGMSMRGILQ